MNTTTPAGVIPAVERSALRYWGRALLIGTGLGVCIPLGLWLFSLQLITSPTPVPKRAEGEQLLGLARDYCRVEWSKSHDVEKVRQMLTAEVKAGHFRGKYFDVAPDLKPTRHGAMLHTTRTTNAEEYDGTGFMTFDWDTGEWEVRWEP
ncbi:MAG: hypothetical protein KDB90_16500 [Planctomycetes bacterium]|nr:hypothetical protein [Planctomycetota bacterium]